MADEDRLEALQAAALEALRAELGDEEPSVEDEIAAKVGAELIDRVCRVMRANEPRWPFTEDDEVGFRFVQLEDGRLGLELAGDVSHAVYVFAEGGAIQQCSELTTVVLDADGTVLLERPTPKGASLN
jgi:hypothetical protein